MLRWPEIKVSVLSGLAGKGGGSMGFSFGRFGIIGGVTEY